MKKPVPLTPEQQKLAADYIKFASITARKFKHLAPFDELLSACQLRLVLCARNYRPDDASGSSFKTYLIRSLRWACSKVITDRRDLVQPCQLSVDVVDYHPGHDEDIDPVESPAQTLTSLIEAYAPSENSRQVMLCRMKHKSDGIAGKLLGITKSRVYQIRNRFIEVVRTRLQLEVA